jgi:hypothetical protein
MFSIHKYVFIFTHLQSKPRVQSLGPDFMMSDMRMS